jgi:calcineurin-like phosphoesterase family protein
MYLNQPNKLFFSSDFHFGHHNIVSGTSNWEDKLGCRNFDTIDEHDECLIQNINDTVNSDAILFFEGDFTLGDHKKVEYYRSLLKVKEIHFVLGNHDPFIKKNKKNIQSLFTSVQSALEIKVLDQHISLNHYAYRVFNHSHRGAWNLFGHSHSSLPDYCEMVEVEINGEIYYKKTNNLYLTLDIGVDSAKEKLGEYKPFSFEEISEIMKNRILTRHH